MKKVSEQYVMSIEGYADISVEIEANGSIRLLGWPSYSVSAETFIKSMRAIADNIEKIKNG